MIGALGAARAFVSRWFARCVWAACAAASTAAPAQTIATVAGRGLPDGVAATGGSAILQYPEGLALDGAGNLYIADTSNQRIRKVVLGTGAITLIAGTGLTGSSGDGGQATSAQFNQPSRLANSCDMMPCPLFEVRDHRCRTPRLRAEHSQ